MLSGFMLLLTACKKQYDWPEDPVYDVIVEGGISTLDTLQYIKLSKPIMFYDTEIQQIHDAEVMLFDGKETIRFKEIDSSGIYTGIVKNNKNFNQAYHLKVTYNEKVYEAVDTLRKIVSERPQNKLKIERKGNQVQLSYPKHVFGTQYPGRFLIQKAPSTWLPLAGQNTYNYSYKHTFGTPNALGSTISPYITQNFSAQDSLDLYTFSMSMGYAKYLYQLFQETDWKGLLSPMPANINGNISGNASGYFYAIDAHRYRIKVKDFGSRTN